LDNMHDVVPMYKDSTNASGAVTGRVKLYVLAQFVDSPPRSVRAPKNRIKVGVPPAVTAPPLDQSVEASRKSLEVGPWPPSIKEAWLNIVREGPDMGASGKWHCPVHGENTERGTLSRAHVCLGTV
jgi:hypothetical protein